MTAASSPTTQTRELRARGKRTMRRLLDAGAEVFEQRGYHAARVDDIVKLAKTSHGTFYLYFANKEELFRVLVDEISTEMAALAEDFPPVAERAELHAWITRFADLYDHYGAMIRAWTEAEVGGSDLGSLGAEVLGGFSRTIAEHIDPKSGLDPQVASLAFVAMMERYQYYVLSGQLKVGRTEMIDTLTTVVDAAVHGS